MWEKIKGADGYVLELAGRESPSSQSALENQPGFLRLVLARTVHILLKVGSLKFAAGFLIAAVLVSVTIVLAIDLLWDSQLNAELQFAGVVTPLLVGLLFIVFITAMLNELRAEVTRREAAERILNEAQRIAKIGNWILELTTDRLIWSEEIFKIFEIDPQHSGASYAAILDTVHPEDRIRVNKVSQCSLTNKLPYSNSYRLLMKDGRTKYVSERSGTIYGANGEPFLRVGTVQDITEHKRLEQELQTSETVFRGLFENMSSAVAIYDAVDDGNDFIFRDFNRSGEKIENLKREQLIGKRLTEVFPKVREFGLLAVLQRVRETGQGEHLPVAFYKDDRITGWRENYVFCLPSGELVAIYDDVTERKQREKDLQDSRENLQLLLDSMTEGAYGTDTNGNCIFVNHAFLQLLGYQDPGEIVGRQTHQLIHHTRPNGDPYPENECKARMAYQNHKTIHVSDEVLWHKDGSCIPVEYWAHPIVKDGTVIGAITTFINISKRKRAELALQDQKNFLSTILETEPECVKVAGADGTLLQMNKAGLSMLEADSIEEVNAYGLINFVLPEYRTAFKDMARLVFAGETCTLEFQVQGKLGKQRWLETHETPLRDSTGKITYLLGITRDITDRKLSDQAIRNESKKNEALLNTASDGIHNLDEKGNLVQFSDSFARILGYSHAEAARLNVTDWDVQIPKDQLVDEVNKLIREPATFETKHRCKDGSIIDVEINAKGVELGGTHYLYASTRDITERKKFLQQLQETNQKLQESLIALDRLASTDKLTGAWNRRRLEEAVINEMDRFTRYGHPLSALIIDIDFFKRINDAYGHVAGDQVLVELVALVQSTLRAADSLTRWGGEEFIVLCPDTPLSTAAMLAERLREKIASSTFPAVGKVTVSIGVAECISGETWEHWLQRVDAALYRAKACGRNQVQIAQEKETTQQTGIGEIPVANFVQLAWNTAYECGNRLIDNQHRILFVDANNLLAAILSGRLKDEISTSIDALVRDVVQHFKDEESIIKAAGFPGAEAHAAIHQQLLDSANDLVGRFQAGTLSIGELFQFLANDVVAQHMLGTDREFFPYLATHSDT